MSDIENRVRSTATELHDAILAARSAGYRVELPHQVDGLPSIAVSASRKAIAPTEIGEAAKAVAEREQGIPADDGAEPAPLSPSRLPRNQVDRPATVE